MKKIIFLNNAPKFAVSTGAARNTIISRVFLHFLILTAIVAPVFSQKKATKKSVPKPSSKAVRQTIATNGIDTITDTKFSMTIENGDQKKEISSGFFDESDSNTIEAGDSKLLLFSTGSSQKDNDRYSFNGAIPKFAKGVYAIADVDQNPGFSITSSEFPNAGALKAKSGTIEITAYPPCAGFVEGRFSGVCVFTNDDGTTGDFKISGSFRLRKRLE